MWEKEKKKVEEEKMELEAWRDWGRPEISFIFDIGGGL